MKQFFVFVSTLATSWLCYALPATPLICESLDGDFKLEAVINHYTGDLYADTLKIYEKGVQKAPDVKQYRNYEENIFIVASLGREGIHDDVGYIIEVEKQFRNPSKASGNAEKYTISPQDGKRKLQRGSYMNVSCKIGTP